jgi:hypothetical protein
MPIVLAIRRLSWLPNIETGHTLSGIELKYLSMFSAAKRHPISSRATGNSTTGESADANCRRVGLFYPRRPVPRPAGPGFGHSSTIARMSSRYRIALGRESVKTRFNFCGGGGASSSNSGFGGSSRRGRSSASTALESTRILSRPPLAKSAARRERLLAPQGGASKVRLLAEEGSVVVILAGLSSCHTLPPNRLSQLLGGPPSGPGSAQTYQSTFELPRDERLSMNQGCWSEV